MNCLSDAISSTSVKHQQHIRVGYEFQATRKGVKVSRIEGVVFWAGSPEDFKDAAQQQHIMFEIEIMIVSQILHPKLSPNPLSMVVVTLTHSRQVEFAVKCFN